MAHDIDNKGIQVDGILDLNKHLERIMKMEPAFEQKVQKVIDGVLLSVRAGVIRDAKAAMGSDPRGAARAVRRIVYQKILGGQVNILRKRRAGQLAELPDSNAKQWWRRRGYTTGMNKRYKGSDRGFILRFANAGTTRRASVTMDNHPFKRKDVWERPAHRQYVNNYTLGYRGRNPGTAFFDRASQHMKAEMVTLDQEIEKLIIEEFNRK